MWHDALEWRWVMSLVSDNYMTTTFRYVGQDFTVADNYRKDVIIVYYDEEGVVEDIIYYYDLTHMV